MFERVDDYLDKLREELSGADPATLHDQGEPLEDTKGNRNRADLDYNGKPMPLTSFFKPR